MEPKRIQRKRIKGWRMPEGVVYVGRPTKWGNPFYVGQTLYFEFVDGYARRVNTRKDAADLFEERCNRRTGSDAAAPSVFVELRGKDLACWCPLDEPCHADVLLRWANEKVE